MSDLPEAEGRVFGTPGSRFLSVEVFCPYCARRHVHDAGEGGRRLGHRVAGCASPTSASLRGYVIVRERVDGNVSRALRAARKARRRRKEGSIDFAG